MHLIEQAMLRVEGLKKVFRSGESDLVLFENLSFQVARGEMLAIVGESGAGKSTLLHILSALDRASAGDVYFANLRLSSLTEDDAADFRNREIGFVWQFHYLLPEFTALENVAMPLLLRGIPWQDAQTEASRWLTEVGLAERTHHRSGELSGGEQQRVALARALITKAEDSVGGRAHRRSRRKDRRLSFRIALALASRLSADFSHRHSQSCVRGPL